MGKDDPKPEGAPFARSLEALVGAALREAFLTTRDRLERQFRAEAGDANEPWTTKEKLVHQIQSTQEQPARPTSTRTKLAKRLLAGRGVDLRTPTIATPPAPPAWNTGNAFPPSDAPAGAPSKRGRRR
jgi:hypothetical protein